jgi:GntR family transcriptional regulator
MESLPDLDPQDKRPIHQQISAGLRTAIEVGTLQPGDTVPGENSLMKRYGVSRWVAREALATLASSGLIEKVPKVGTFVRKTQRLERRSRSRYGRARADGQLLTSHLRHEIVHAGRTEVPAHIAAAAGIEPGTQVVVRQRHLYDRESGRLEEIGASYLPLDVAADTYLEEPAVVPKALFLCVEELSGKGYHRATDRWLARPPSEHEAVRFGLSTGSHVMQVIHVATAEDGGWLEVSESVWPADRVVIVDDYPIAQEPEQPDAVSDI